MWVDTQYFLLSNVEHLPNVTSGCESPASNELFANVSANCEVCVRMGGM